MCVFAVLCTRYACMHASPAAAPAAHAAAPPFPRPAAAAPLVPLLCLMAVRTSSSPRSRVGSSRRSWRPYTSRKRWLRVCVCCVCGCARAAQLPNITRQPQVQQRVRRTKHSHTRARRAGAPTGCAPRRAAPTGSCPRSAPRAVSCSGLRTRTAAAAARQTCACVCACVCLCVCGVRIATVCALVGN